MKNYYSIMMLSLAIVLTIAGCKRTSVEPRQMAGVLDGPLPADTLPATVRQAFDRALRFHEHDVLSDTISNIAVFAIDEIDQVSSEGYGIVVTKGASSTTFPEIRNTRQPQACYNAKTGDLWLTSSAMEGTGVRVERLYQIRFRDDGSAYIQSEQNPYTLQQALLQRVGYTVSGERVTLYDGASELATIENTVSDMGGFDSEQPLWIGEQLYFDVSTGSPQVVFVPGVNFTTGLVLHYDDMPELSAPLTIGDDGQLRSVGLVSIRQTP